MSERPGDIGFDRTCYWSFDLAGVEVRAVIERFCEDILRGPPSDLDGPVYFFLDEVQNRPDWSQKVNHYVDHYDDIQVTVTGSSAVNVLKGAGESLWYVVLPKSGCTRR